MVKHIHAELMKQYAEDASNYEFPYTLWQYNVSGEWRDLSKHPEWHYDHKYRRKPIEQLEMATLSFAFMKPLKLYDIKFRDPEQLVHYPSFDYDDCRFKVQSIKVGSIFGKPRIVVHTTKENAQMHVDILNQVYLGERR